MIQNYGPQNDVNLGVSGFYHLKKMEGKLDIQLQSQLSELGQIPGAGHLPFSPEQLLLESRLHLSLLNDKLDYQLS